MPPLRLLHPPKEAETINTNRFPLPCFQGARFYLGVVAFIFSLLESHINSYANIDLIPRSGAYLPLVPRQSITFPRAIPAARQEEEKELRRACGYMWMPGFLF